MIEGWAFSIFTVTWFGLRSAIPLETTHSVLLVLIIAIGIVSYFVPALSIWGTQEQAWRPQSRRGSERLPATHAPYWLWEDANNKLLVATSSPAVFNIDVGNADESLGKTKWQTFDVTNKGDQDRECQAYVDKVTKNGESVSLLKGARMFLYAFARGDKGSDQPQLIKAHGTRKFDLVNATDGNDQLSVSSTVFVELHDQQKVLPGFAIGTYVFAVGISCNGNGPDELTDITLRYEAATIS
jgi:hypothetical protein